MDVDLFGTKRSSGRETSVEMNSHDASRPTGWMKYMSMMMKTSEHIMVAFISVL